MTDSPNPVGHRHRVARKPGRSERVVTSPGRATIMTEQPTDTESRGLLLRIESVRTRMRSWSLTLGQPGYIDTNDEDNLDPEDLRYLRADHPQLSAYHDRIDPTARTPRSNLITRLNCVGAPDWHSRAELTHPPKQRVRVGALERSIVGPHIRDGLGKTHGSSAAAPMPRPRPGIPPSTLSALLVRGPAHHTSPRPRPSDQGSTGDTSCTSLSRPGLSAANTGSR